MREFQQRNRTRKRLYSKTVLLVLFIFVLLVARGVVSVYFKERESRVEMERANEQRAELQARYDRIKDRSDHLQSDAGIEAEIRSKFDVIKEGEGVIVIVDKELPVVEEDKRGVLKKFWDSVVGVFKKDEATTTEDGSSE
ncbi:MAG TPA: septum formation initiator family protein [Candidatus Paceibacterota bacterium]